MNNINKTLHITSLLLFLFLAQLYLHDVALAETKSKKETTPDKKMGSVIDEKNTDKQFQDWVLKCSDKGLNDDQCYIKQDVSIQESDPRILRVLVGYLGTKKKPLMIFTLPLGTLLTTGMTFNIDDGEKNKLPIHICLSGGCKVRIILDKKLINALKMGSQVRVSFIKGITRKQVEVDISLKGFTKGFAAL